MAEKESRPGVSEIAALLGEAVLDALPSPTVLLDADGTVLLTNSAWSSITEPAERGRLALRVGDNYFDSALALRDDDTARAVVDQLRELAAGTRRLVSVDYAVPHRGGSRWLHVQASRVDESGRVVVTHTDITARVSAEQSLAWQARHDHLTDLPNRAHLHELIDAELRHPDRGSVTVLFLDVDGFKDVNDSLGHEVGDELLRQLSARLTHRTRAEDTVGRLGGDEFVVLCRDCDADGAHALALRCQSAFEEPFALGGRTIRLSSSIGIATAAPEDRPGVRSTDLVRDADLAMYAAKAAGRNRIRIFSPDLRSAVQRKVLVAGELREAIEAGAFELRYQPVLHLRTGAVQGVESLVRWPHPERGVVPTSEWLPLAEQHDLMGPITRWVLATATQQAADWARRGIPLFVGVNVGAASLAPGTLVEEVRDALALSGLPPELLLVQVTERAVAGDPRGAVAQFADLRVSGVEIAVDDFGSGSSSLGQLVKLPAGVLRIDRGLVAAVEGPAGQGAAAIAAVVGLAQACGMRCLAEGVESTEQLRLARDLGCTYAQGPVVAEPMPAGELAGWLADCPAFLPGPLAGAGR